MAFTEVTHDSWGSRLMKSIKSVLVGLAMFVISFPLLFWNEGRAVQTAKSLDEGAASVQSVASEKVDPSKEGKLVHTSGMATTEEILKDPDFKVEAKAIKLVRDVEMYQWEETKKTEEQKNVGGSTTTKTTYDYRKTWSSSLIDSTGFKESVIHSNPDAMRYESRTLTAKNVTLGAFTLTDGQISQIDKASDLAIDAKAIEGFPLKASVATGTIYIGEDSGEPEIGDMKVSFESVPPMVVSVVAQQAGSTFAPYQTSAGDALLLVQDGQITAAAMFQAAQAANAMMTWILRLIGFVLMFAGLFAIFKPISVLGDVVPLVGSMLGAGLGLFAFLISVALTLLTVGVAWLFYRPILGVVLLLIAGGAIAGLVKLGLNKRKAKAAAAPAAT
ncbi:MAG: TMEM43 family protein [Myxococcaceae bacterium]